VLRGIQERLAGIVHGTTDRLTEISPPVPPAWVPIPMVAYDPYWTSFNQRFAFRPGMRSWPAIEEPRPSVMIDLVPIFTGGRAHAGRNVPVSGGHVVGAPVCVGGACLD
jgi:hypothetical protein